MKTLLLARGSLGRAAFRYITGAYPGDVVAVVTMGEDDIFMAAKAMHIPALTYSGSDELVGELRTRGIRPDLGFLVWWPSIIREPLLSYPERGFVNTHPSLLPHCRGSMANFWTLVEKAPYGVSIHQVADTVDSGPVLAQSGIDVGWEDTDETLYARSLTELERLIAASYPGLREGKLIPTPQLTSAKHPHTVAETNAQLELDLDAPTTGRDFLNLLRARSYPGAPGCWFEEDGARYEVRVRIARTEGGRTEP